MPTSEQHNPTTIDRRTLIKRAGQGAALAFAGPFLVTNRGLAAPQTASAATAPRPGGQLTIATGDGLGRDFFAGNSFGPQAFAWFQFVWPLFRFEPGTYDLIPALAESAAASEDRLTHTITLRPGLTFHDGSPLDADAVVANYKSAFYSEDPLRGPGTYLMIPLFWGGFPGIVSDITAVDEATVQLTLSEPRFDVSASLSAIPIFNPAVLANESYGTDVGALADAGSGPFRLERFEAGTFAEYSRVDGFFEAAYLDALRIQLMGDPSARFLALQGGEVQAAIGLTKADWDANVDNPELRAHIGNKGNNVFLGVNPNIHPELASADVRRAIAMALNRSSYIDAFWGEGLADLSSQVALAPGVPGYNDTLEPLPFDPEAARGLLEQAGVSELELSVIDPPAFAAAPELAAMLDAMASDLADVGVQLKITITDVPGWLAGGDQNDFSVAPYGNGGGVQAAVAALLFNRPPNRAQIADAEVYRPLVLEALRAPSIEEQTAALEELLALATENVVGIPLAYTAPAALSLASVHDLAITASPIDPQHRAWIDQ